jgi:predicted transcriptional regulator of viral defense system
MNLQKIYDIEKPVFNAEDIANVLSISIKSAQVTASRYVSRGLLIRLKRDLFILPHQMQIATEEEIFYIANLLQTPSYISLTTALSYYELTTQQTPNFIESIASKRTIMFEVKNFQFNFSIVKDEFYFGFERKGIFFIATPEKALADMIYLSSQGNYNADFEAVDFNGFNKSEIEMILNKSSKAAQNLWQKLIKTYGN